MWDNHDTTRGAEPPKFECERVGVTLTMQRGDMLLVAEYPNVAVIGHRAWAHPLTNPDPYEVRIGVSNDGDPWRSPAEVRRDSGGRDLDLRIRGRIERVKEDGTMAYFTDMEAVRANADKKAAENKALRAEVRALRARVRALGGDS